MSEKAHMTADDLLLGGDRAVNGDLGRRRTRMGREEVVSYGSGPVAVVGEEMEPDEKLEKVHGISSYNGERRKSSKHGNQVYEQGFPLPIRSRTRITTDPRDSELERDILEVRSEQLDRNKVGMGSRIRIVPDEEKERERRDREKDIGKVTPSIPRVEIQDPQQDEIVVFEEDDSEERPRRRSRAGGRLRERSSARTIDTWEKSDVGESTLFVPAPSNKSRGRSGVGERERERNLSIPRSVDSWERSDVGESTILSQRTKSRTPKSRSRVSARDKRDRSSTRTVDTWERSEVGESTVLSGPGGRARTPRSGLGARDRERERSRLEKEREREREKERDSGYEGEVERAYGGRGYDGEGERWHGRGYEYKENRGHSPVPSRLGESRRDRKMWSERGSGMSGRG